MMAVIFVSCVDFLIMTETDGLSPLYCSLSDSLNIVESYTSNFKSSTQNDLLTIDETFTLNISREVSMSDTLTIVERFPSRVFDLLLIDTLGFVEAFTAYVNIPTVTETLVTTETFDVVVSKPSTDDLIIDETFTLNINRNLFCSDTLDVREGFSQFKPDPINSPPGYNTSTTTDPIIFKIGSRELSYRHYEFGNKQTLEFTRTNTRSKGGDLIIGPTQLEIETLNFTFLLLKEKECNDLQQFFRDTLGQQIEFRDHESKWWDGIVMNPDTQKVQTGRHTFTLQVTFEGVLQ